MDPEPRWPSWKLPRLDPEPRWPSRKLQDSTPVGPSSNACASAGAPRPLLEALPALEPPGRRPPSAGTSKMCSMNASPPSASSSMSSGTGTAGNS